MAKQLHPIVKLAKEAVEGYVRHGKLLRPTELTAEMKGRAGVFVSIKKRGELRGCIGSLEAEFLHRQRSQFREPGFELAV